MANMLFPAITDKFTVNGMCYIRKQIPIIQKKTAIYFSDVLFPED